MNEISIYKGNFLDIILSNSTSSIRGLEYPHVIFLSTFLFMDHDFDSFKKLYSLHTNPDVRLDDHTFYFALAYLAFYHSLDGELDHHNFDQEFKKLKFSNKDHKKALNYTFDIIVNDNFTAIEPLKKLAIDPAILSLLSVFCFKYSKLSFSDYSLYYPELYNIFSLDNDLLTVTSFADLLDLIDNNGFLVISFINKFYHLLDEDLKLKIITELFNRKIFDVNILHKFLILSPYDDNTFNNFIKFFDTYKPFIDEKITLTINHYLILRSFLLKNYPSSVSLYNNSSINKEDGLISTDFDSFIDWNLDDYRFNPVSYWHHQKNSRFLLNSFRDLISTRDTFNKINSESSSAKKINVIGGLQALSWHDISNTNISFHYTNRFLPDENLFSLNDLDKSLLVEKNSITIINFDIEMLLHHDIKSFLEDILNEIKLLASFKNIVFTTIPFPSIASHNYLSYNVLYEKIVNFNTLLLSLSSNHYFRIIDLQKYIGEIHQIKKNSNNIAPIYSNNENLLCNFFIKPDIIKLIISELSV